MIDSRQSPAYAADQRDLPLAEVYEALFYYYYGHIEEMRESEQENEAAFDRVREVSLKPKETVQ